MKKKIVNNFENFSIMDLKLWEYIFEMFNYKIRQKKSIFSKLQTLTPPLKLLHVQGVEQKFDQKIFKNCKN